MKHRGYIVMALLLVSAGAYAQKTDRDYLRSGNKLYADSLFVKAEVDYRKALTGTGGWDQSFQTCLKTR